MFNKKRGENSLNNIIKYLRRSSEFDLTQEELAKKLGISRATINSIERGAIPSGPLMLKISKFFNKDIREIFFDNSVEHFEQNEGR